MSNLAYCIECDTGINAEDYSVQDITDGIHVCGECGHRNPVHVPLFEYLEEQAVKIKDLNERLTRLERIIVKHIKP